jgi:hypothetical protein
MPTRHKIDKLSNFRPSSHKTSPPTPPLLPGEGGFSLTDRSTPLLLEEKGLGDEVHATKKNYNVWS